MEEGHPYRTDELDDLRGRQRRTLEVLRRSNEGEERWFTRVETSYTPEGPRERVELACRREAERIFDKHRTWLDTEETVQSWASVTEVVDALHHVGRDGRRTILRFGPHTAQHGDETWDEQHERESELEAAVAILLWINAES